MAHDPDEPLFIVLQTGEGEELERIQVWPVTNNSVRAAFDFQDRVTGLVRRMQATRLNEYLHEGEPT